MCLLLCDFRPFASIQCDSTLPFYSQHVRRYFLDVFHASAYLCIGYWCRLNLQSNMWTRKKKKRNAMEGLFLCSLWSSVSNDTDWVQTVQISNVDDDDGKRSIFGVMGWCVIVAFAKRMSLIAANIKTLPANLLLSNISVVFLLPIRHLTFDYNSSSRKNHSKFLLNKQDQFSKHLTKTMAVSSRRRFYPVSISPVNNLTFSDAISLLFSSCCLSIETSIQQKSIVLIREQTKTRKKNITTKTIEIYEM